MFELRYDTSVSGPAAEEPTVTTSLETSSTEPEASPTTSSADSDGTTFVATIGRTDFGVSGGG